MDGVKGFLESIEKLIYELLLWIIFIPKTFFKVVSNPTWAPDYVAKELGEDKANRFDDFISPLILLLLTSVIPLAVYNSLPTLGVSIEGPVQGHVGKFYTFKAKPNFILTNESITYDWDVDYCELDHTGEPSETQADENIAEDESMVDEPVEHQTDDYFQVAENDDNQECSWSSPGFHVVGVWAANESGEGYYTLHEIEIRESGLVVDETPKVTDAGGSKKDKKADSKKAAISKKIREDLEGEGTFIAALIFLSFPFLFTLAIEMFRGRPIAGDFLRNTLYVQCYYFSPFILSIWALILFVEHFYVIDYNEALLAFIVCLSLGMFLWFVVNEIKIIARSREIGIFKATGVFLICALLILIAISTFFYIEIFPNSLGSLVWWGYVSLTVFAFLAGLVQKFKKRKTVAEET